MRCNFENELSLIRNVNVYERLTNDFYTNTDEFVTVAIFNTNDTR